MMATECRPFCRCWNMSECCSLQQKTLVGARACVCVWGALGIQQQQLCCVFESWTLRLHSPVSCVASASGASVSIILCQQVSWCLCLLSRRKERTGPLASAPQFTPFVPPTNELIHLHQGDRNWNIPFGKWFQVVLVCLSVFCHTLF